MARIDVNQEDYYFTVSIDDDEGVSVFIRGASSIDAINLAYQTLNHAKKALDIINHGPDSIVPDTQGSDTEEEGND